MAYITYITGGSYPQDNDGKINIDIMQLLIISYPHIFTYNKHWKVAYITYITGGSYLQDSDGKINIDIMQLLIICYPHPFTYNKHWKAAYIAYNNKWILYRRQWW